MKRNEVLLKIAKELHRQALILDDVSGSQNVSEIFSDFQKEWLADAEIILNLMEEATLNLNWEKED